MNQSSYGKLPYNFEKPTICDKSLIRSEGDGEEHQRNPVHRIEAALYTKKFNNVTENSNEIPKTTTEQFSNLSHYVCKLKKESPMISSLISAPDPLLLSAPPQDFDKVEKHLLRPTVAFTDTKMNYSTHKRKEPKFVPYEPYRACVKPIINPKNENQNLKNFTTCNEPKFNLDVNLSKTKKESRVTKSLISDFEIERMKWKIENDNLLKENENFRRELQTVQNEYTTSQQQLSTLSQINSELKKLLVASVGEDVQGRVQCLTEDKARMATMIRKYSEKVDKDYEDKEKVSIQCDVWRSKYLASSVLIDELAYWKSTLVQRLDSAKEALKLLLHERDVAHPNLIDTFKSIYQVQEAFDPLHSDSGGAFLLDSCDMVSVCLANSNMSESLRDRLLGSIGRSASTINFKLPQETRTAGEKMAFQILNEELESNASTLICSKDRLLAHKYHPCTNYDRITMNCCAKCNGDIIVI